jgi:Rieske Fe-S protein
MSNALSPISRRHFCAGACRAASGAALATVLSGCSGGDSSPTAPSSRAVTLGAITGRYTGSGVEVTIAGSALANVGGAVLVNSVAGVFLMARTGDATFTAIDATCSHEACTVTDADGSVYVCPCHGSRYDRNGRVLGGPATASLRQFPTSEAGGVVTIAA